ncbi:hypothetical protein DM01DRAFT_1338948 [Hesseltinella vesiculosa]|uniref:Myb-like domain-containing protein n=1 Tax=Hesseltinella vesiculosa TaxID=101127 RepID=A0A1X2G9K8_9FUNG|nr:hypothetical protein DM01DRAFT_1338948 [Hesseltinella vesiculosa]
MVEGNLPPTERGRLATPSPPAKRNRAKKIKFTPLETQSLEDGMREFGTSWSEILKKYEDIFAPNQRTNVDLKDKARTEVKKRKTYNMSLGGFAAVDPK